MITLFHHPKSRSTRFIFLLEELEAPYRLQRVTMRRSDGTGAVDPANPHPHGKVPAIADDGIVVFESPAIALYLTDRFPKNRVGPAVGDPSRGAYLLGDHFSAADVLYGTTFAMFGQSPLLPKSLVVDDYVQRIVTRPAFARAQALDDGG